MSSAIGDMQVAKDLRQIPKAFFADPDNSAITAKLVELDKTELAGDSNTIGALAKQMAAKAARSKYGMTLEMAKLFVRVVCQYGLNYSSPEWQERIAFHRHVLTGVPADVEEAAAP
ncbi:hypothetical protein HaLaN_07784, partial [Haematococcus lacustris]